MVISRASSYSNIFLLLIFILSCLTSCSHYSSEIRPFTKGAYANPSDRLLANDWLAYRQTNTAYLTDSVLCTADNKKTAFFVTLSGGGSRAAYFAATILHELDHIGSKPLTPYIDGIFSVSGGSITAALYGISANTLAMSHEDGTRPIWSEKLTDAVLTKPLTWPMASELLNPASLGSYLFGGLSRTDLLQNAIEREVFQNTEAPITYSFLNSKRPPIYIISAVATMEGQDAFAPQPFGSLFIFSHSSLAKLGDDLASVPLAKAVTASAAFPGLLSPVTLPRYRRSVHETQLDIPRYIHLIDGGNADNLGLLGVKHALLENGHRLLRDCDNIVVLSVDAFGRQGVHQDDRLRERSPVGWFFDHKSALASFDALLAANRARLLGEFKSRVFMPPGSEELCLKDGLPDDVCSGGVRADWTEINRLIKQKLYFVHVNLASPEIASQTNVTICTSAYPDESGCQVKPVNSFRLACEQDKLMERVQSIPTKFGLAQEESSDIRTFVSMLNHPHNICFRHLSDVVANGKTHTSKFYEKASASCDETPVLKRNEVPIVKCNIRGRIFGDVIIHDMKKRLTTFREECQSLTQYSHEESINFLYDAKNRLMAAPEHLEGGCEVKEE